MKNAKFSIARRSSLPSGAFLLEAPINFALLTLLVLAGCATPTKFVEADPKQAPTCSEMRAIFRASENDFETIRTNLEVSRSGSIYKTFETTLKLTGASSCVVRKHGIDYEYYCRWDTGNDRALMGAHYRGIRDQLKACIKDGSVYQDDRGGSTRITVETKEQLMSFWVMARYENAPYYVTLSVKR